MGKKLLAERDQIASFPELHGSCRSCPEAAWERSYLTPGEFPLSKIRFFFLPHYFLHCQVWRAYGARMQGCCTMQGASKLTPAGALLMPRLAIALKLFKLKLLLKDVLLTSARLPSLSAMQALAQLGGGIAAKLSWKRAN